MNAFKSLALAFVVGFFVAAPVSGCGPTSSKCDADSCEHGCCDSAGKCQTANSIFQCGQGGLSCQVCGATQQCIIGICTGSSGAGPGGGSGTTGGGVGFTGGGAGITGGGVGTTGGGSTTGGGVGTTGGGSTTGGGVGTTGGGSTTGGGVGTTGGGTAVNCSAATPMTFSGGSASVSGTTVDKGSDIIFACDTSLSSGTDVIYSFTVAGLPVTLNATVSFDTSVYGGLAIVQLGQCTSRSTSSTECNSPTESTNTITALLNPGQWGLVVKTYSDGSQSNPGNYFINATVSTTGTGGGSGTTGGGSGTTGGGTGTTGGGSGTGGGTGSPTCGECTSGPAKTASCSPCTAAVCAQDAFCCTDSWDNSCVGEVATYCTFSCTP